MKTDQPPTLMRYSVRQPEFWVAVLAFVGGLVVVGWVAERFGIAPRHAVVLGAGIVVLFDPLYDRLTDSVAERYQALQEAER